MFLNLLSLYIRYKEIEAWDAPRDSFVVKALVKFVMKEAKSVMWGSVFSFSSSQFFYTKNYRRRDERFESRTNGGENRRDRHEKKRGSKLKSNWLKGKRKERMKWMRGSKVKKRKEEEKREEKKVKSVWQESTDRDRNKDCDSPFILFFMLYLNVFRFHSFPIIMTSFMISWETKWSRSEKRSLNHTQNQDLPSLSLYFNELQDRKASV